MIKSMTGFGRAEANVEGIKLTIEIRSVNHKYHDIMFKMPKDLLMIEDQMKKIVQNYIKRGRVDVFVSIDVEENPFQEIKVDWNLAKQLIQASEELKQRLQVEGKLEIKDLIHVPELIQVGQELPDVELLAPNLFSTIEEACQNLMNMRKNEGKHLYHDLSSKIQTLTELQQKMKKRAPFVIDEYREKLKARVTEWLNSHTEVDESRLLNEVALFSDKVNIDEELTRLQSHFQQFVSFIEMEDPDGRKLDFLIQEMNREVNTVGSKANDITLSQLVVDMKSELEKMREQIQNVE